MKTGKNYSGSLLVWLDDGTEVIFSDFATKQIENRPAEMKLNDAILAILINHTVPSLNNQEQEDLILEDCDLKGEVDELKEVVEMENLMVSEEMLKIRQDIEVINRKVDSLASTLIGDQNQRQRPNPSKKRRT